MAEPAGIVLFDLDGTLTDPRQGITRGIQHALRAFAIDEPDLHKLEAFIGPPLRQSFMDFYGFSAAAAKAAVVEYRAYFDPIGWRENKVYEGIPEMLQELQDAGIRIGLATSKPTVSAERILSYFHLRSAFTVVIGSNLDGTREDKGEVIEAALAGLGLSVLGCDCNREGTEGSSSGLRLPGARLAVMVGDRSYDMIGAKHNGMKAVGVTYGFGSREELAAAGADSIVTRPDELLAAILRLMGR